MRKTARAFVLVVLTLLSAVVIGVASTTTAAITLAASQALIMGGTGRPDPQDFPGYMENVASYYIYPNTSCQSAADCESVSVFTPETAWPLYGGLTALTWRDSILQGVEDLDAVVGPAIDQLGSGDHLAILGYSQSGAIVAFEKQRLADDPTTPQDQIEFVIIGNSSRPNGGINNRIPFSIPTVNFPFGPPTPTDTEMQTTDIAFKWDIIADAPLYITNPLAWLNALLGFEYVHGTMPDPTEASPDSTPGGYTVEEWQAMMDDPENPAYADIIDVQEFGDTTYITVTPTVLPLVQPLHDFGLKPLADLFEPALRVLIEQTGYNRSINPGVPTPFQLIPIFNPITLTIDLIAAAIEGVQNFVNDIVGLAGVSPAPLAPMDASTMSTFADTNPPEPPTMLEAPKPEPRPEMQLTNNTLSQVTTDDTSSLNSTFERLTLPKPLSSVAPDSDKPKVKTGSKFEPGSTELDQSQTQVTNQQTTTGTTPTTTPTATELPGANETGITTPTSDELATADDPTNAPSNNTAA